MSRFELPEDWVKGLLEQAVTVKSGVGFPHKFQGKLTGDFPVYKVGDLSKAVLENNGYLCRAGNYVNTDEISQLKGEVFPKGSTLFAKIGEAVKLNRRAYVEVEGLADNNVMSVVPVIEQSKRFIYYFLKTVDLTDVSRSTTVPSIRKGDIEQLPINWPSLAEQKVIADKLDTLLAQVESIKARLERIPEILKQFRQSVLVDAVSEHKGNLKTLSEVSEKITDGEHLTPKTVEIGIPLLSAKDVQEKELLFSSCKYVERFVADKARARCNPEINDILIVSRGATVGRTHLIKVEDEFCLMGSVLLLKLNAELVNPKYMELVLKSFDGQKQLLAASGSSAQQAIYIRDVKNLSFKLPNLDVQNKAVKLVETWFYKLNIIEKQVQSALDRVNNLTQSILAKAFRGELTTEWREANPELISGKNSAEALLERIKAEHELAKSATKRGRGKA